MSIRSLPSNILTAYATKGKVAMFSVPGNKQCYVYNVRAANNSSGAINVGLLKKFYNPSGQTATSGGGYALFQYTAVGPVITDVTSQITAGTATNIFTATNNDGFIVGGHAMFGMVGLTISTARAGLTLTYKYWNGSVYTTLTTLESATYGSTGDVWTVFQPPSDWVAGGTTGVNQNQFTLLIQATTAGAGVVAVTSLWVAKFLELYEGVANNGVVQLSFPDTKPLLLDGGETLIPYFATAAAGNQIGAYFSLV